MACVAMYPSISVYPSGAARMTNSLAIAPLAPALLSTMTGCLRIADRPWPMTRAIASLAPPGAVGTTMVMDFSGKAANALPQASTLARVAAAIRWRRGNCMSTPVDLDWELASLLFLSGPYGPAVRTSCELHV